MTPNEVERMIEAAQERRDLRKSQTRSINALIIAALLLIAWWAWK